MPILKILPCWDADEQFAARNRQLRISHAHAAALGHSAVQAARKGYYTSARGQRVDWEAFVEAACTAKVSIPPNAALPKSERSPYAEMYVQVTGETTLAAAWRLVEQGYRPVALNFANGVEPGGGVFRGALAQEESLCRSSALYLTLIGDPMYDYHEQYCGPEFSDWVIYSPKVPVFRNDAGQALEKPWLLSFITCAAPIAPLVGQPRSAELLRARIHRVLAIAQAYAHEAIVLGAWGCGAFGNDPYQTAIDFRHALETVFNGAFREVVFAITDLSETQRFLRPFCEVFAPYTDDAPAP